VVSAVQEQEELVEEVQMVPGYVGLIKLAKQTGDISDVYAVVVDECEKELEYFCVERGLANTVHHKQRFDVPRTGNLFAVYGVVKFKDGTFHFEALSKDDVEKIRARSKTPNSGPWVTDYFAMAKKTAIKQALKTIPKSAEKPQLAQALAADNAAEMGEAFSGELAEALDAEAEVVVDEPVQPKSRTQELASKLQVDMQTGEITP
jgi:recombination protein RecT